MHISLMVTLKLVCPITLCVRARIRTRAHTCTHVARVVHTHKHSQWQRCDRIWMATQTGSAITISTLHGDRYLGNAGAAAAAAAANAPGADATATATVATTTVTAATAAAAALAAEISEPTRVYTEPRAEEAATTATSVTTTATATISRLVTLVARLRRETTNHCASNGSGQTTVVNQNTRRQRQPSTQSA